MESKVGKFFAKNLQRTESNSKEYLRNILNTMLLIFADVFHAQRWHMVMKRVPTVAVMFDVTQIVRDHGPVNVPRSFEVNTPTDT